MTVLITGAGLVGSQVARLEVERGRRPILFDISPQLDALRTILDTDKVRVVRGNVLNQRDLLHAIESEGVDYIIHTAANPMLTLGAQENPYKAIRLNIMGTANVLEAARKNGIKRVVFTSSGVIYHYSTQGDFGAQRPSTIYASTKLACEHLGLNYADWFEVDFVAVRLAAVFGPWPAKGGGGPTQTFKEAIQNALRGKPASIPNHQVEYVYSKDAAQGIVLACNAASLDQRIFNLGMGKLYTPSQIAKIIMKVISGARIEVREPSKEALVRGVVREAMDITESREKLGYVPRYDMEAAVRDYVAWSKQLG